MNQVLDSPFCSLIMNRFQQICFAEDTEGHLISMIPR